MKTRYPEKSEASLGWLLARRPVTTYAFAAIVLATGASLMSSSDAVEPVDQLETLATFQANARAHWADGYAFANMPTTASYTPDPLRSFNRMGGAITVTKIASTTGRYRVQFAQLSDLLGSSSTVLVTAFGSNDAYCKPAGPKLDSDVVEVRCFDASTNGAVNTQFTVLVTRTNVDLAYAHANNPTGTNYAPPGSSSWNPDGPIRIFRDGPGAYRATFTGFGTRADSAGTINLQMNAVGTDNKFCEGSSFSFSPVPPAVLEFFVFCYTQAGVRSNSKFNGLALLPADHLAFALVTSSGTPTDFVWNPGGGAVGVQRFGAGQYLVTFNGFNGHLLDGGTAHVTALDGQCKVTLWGSDTVGVICFHHTGGLIDSDFSVLLGS